MRHAYLVLVVVPILATATVGEVWAQDKPPTERDLPSRYFLGKEEQMLLPVNILGLVQKPGQYMVPFRTDLISLIAYAGGFSQDAKINEIKIVRNAPTSANQRSKPRVFRVDVKRYFETGDPNQIPQLMPDDTVLVTGTAAKTVGRVFDFISKLVILAQLAFYITVAVDRRN